MIECIWLLLAQGKSPKDQHLISTNLELYYTRACLSNPRDVPSRNIPRTQTWFWVGDSDKIDPKCVTSCFRHKTSHSRFDVMLSGFEKGFLNFSWKLSNFPGNGTIWQFCHFVTWAETICCRFVYFHLCQLQGVGGMQQGGTGGRWWVLGCALGGLDCCLIFLVRLPGMGQHTHCNTLQHAATHCNARNVVFFR